MRLGEICGAERYKNRANVASGGSLQELRIFGKRHAFEIGRIDRSGVLVAPAAFVDRGPAHKSRNIA